MTTIVVIVIVITTITVTRIVITTIDVIMDSAIFSARGTAGCQQQNTRECQKNHE